MNAIPLFPPLDPSTPFTWRQGQVIRRGRFQHDVLSLAERLPAQGALLNLCQDRYHFAVSLFAAFARGLLTVLPNSAAPEHLAAVAAEQTDLLVLGDQADNPLPSHPFLHINLDGEDPADWRRDNPLIPAGRRVACVYTSGSTGTPSAHYKTFGRLRLAILAGAERVWDTAGGRCSVLGTVPIRHMYGLESSVLLPVLAGGRMSTRLPFFPADIAASLAEMTAPRLLVITPFHLRKLLEADITLPPVAAILSATAPLSVELARQAEARLGCPVLEIYGSTETGQLATRQPCRDDIWHNVAGITLQQQGEDTWAVGEVYETPQILNDTVELLSADTFRLIDRKANMINVAGKRSSLTYLNNLITRLPGVEDGVFCIPRTRHAREVERLAAFVVAPSLQREAILAGLRAHIDPVFLPRPIVFVDSLPRDGNGKILARTLEALIQQHIDGPESP
ncbi:xanthomonadin biosynthesis 3-hydroxybenozate--AMP ligase XanA2 [Paludibacterium sp. THUN1379]|uniref:AMP-binding protein n=1 Tax=Paludibacterium sp. THUN1379 TaxID=3112107 RepID=UPI00308A1C69|nr:xanthomonadin biosynthesis 3-hydroxybenozate--AMP ligase XanA2 [Paludibacterium sp. THUN1379]